MTVESKLVVLRGMAASFRILSRAREFFCFPRDVGRRAAQSKNLSWVESAATNGD
jgi:hypothetical protein